MKKNPVTIDPSMKNGYIPAPYVLEEGDNINDMYLEPVLFHNENGPTIGVTTCGVIVKDGLYFKDMDNDGVLSPYEDWRNSHEVRAADMVAHLPLKQQAGLVLNTLWNTPLSFTQEGAKDDQGNIVPSKIFKQYDPSEPEPRSILPGVSMRVDDSQVLENKLAAGVYRGEMRAEAAVAALYHNLGTQYVEYEACQGGVAIPYSLHTNPINIGYPDFLGFGAAVMGDGNFDIVYNMAETDRKMMAACGLNIMYGPQVDVSTDPRWPRNSGTYGERPEITAGITKELVRGYQNGEDGLKKGSIALTVKHFPGDGPAENGFEPHLPIGQWRLYPTEGSMAKYHLPPFQAAFDMNASAIMPDYSRICNDGRSVPQYYKGKLTSSEAVPSTYSKELITDLARDTMGFTGYVNSDSGITSVQIYGVEDLTVPQRYAKAISAGTDVIGGNSDSENIVAAVEQGYLPKADLDRANYRRLLSLFQQERVDNPYLDPAEADRVRSENYEGAKKAAYAACQKEVVLAKNHGAVLPMVKGKKVYVAVFAGDDAGAAIAQSMGAGVAGEATNEALRVQLGEMLKAKGYEIVQTPEECDYCYMHVWPKQNNIVFVQRSMPVLELVEGFMHEEREVNKSQKKTGNLIEINTLRGVGKIPALAETVHAHGGKVIATCVVCNPWILDKLEPYCDGLTFQYTISPVAMGNALGAQMDVLSGEFNPTGKMSLTMVSGPEVIAITEKEIDGVVREICASPNDVPGYDKDQYIDPAILAKVKGGSYAYCDEDGNYYRSGFGLRY
ncbi:MAG: glycoside hydrolase family 3 protein [Oscillospiraceae bacterium]|nr:glycoside hydrolase family 3 protein [Oscillospiraceae bacterium]MBQ7130268.1 glycoside hydrolase family 3 protein [Oscillospiraceae bacterium]